MSFEALGFVGAIVSTDTEVTSRIAFEHVDLSVAMGSGEGFGSVFETAGESARIVELIPIAREGRLVGGEREFEIVGRAEGIA